MTAGCSFGRAGAAHSRGAREGKYLVEVILVKLPHEAAKVVVAVDGGQELAREPVRFQDHKGLARLRPCDNVLDTRVFQEPVRCRAACRWQPAPLLGTATR